MKVTTTQRKVLAYSQALRNALEEGIRGTDYEGRLEGFIKNLGIAEALTTAAQKYKNDRASSNPLLEENVSIQFMPFVLELFEQHKDHWVEKLPHWKRAELEKEGADALQNERGATVTDKVFAGIRGRMFDFATTSTAESFMDTLRRGPEQFLAAAVKRAPLKREQKCRTCQIAVERAGRDEARSILEPSGVRLLDSLEETFDVLDRLKALIKGMIPSRGITVRNLDAFADALQMYFDGTPLGAVAAWLQNQLEGHGESKPNRGAYEKCLLRVVDRVRTRLAMELGIQDEDLQDDQTR